MPLILCKKSKKSNEALLRKLQKTLFLGIFDNFRPSRGECENCYIEFFCINQFNTHRLTFTQKIKKYDNPNWLYAPEMLIFAIFDTFGTPKESNQIFRCVKLCVKWKVSYASNIVQKIKKNLMKRFCENCKKPYFWAFLSIFRGAHVAWLLF